MPRTKRELVVDALGELGVFDPDTDQLDRALRRLDDMMATWQANSITVGYALTSDGESSLNQDSGVPDTVAETVFTNLAIRLAPSYGKTIGTELRKAARDGYDALMLPSAMPVPQKFDETMPIGAGNRSPFGSIYFPVPETDLMPVGDGGDLQPTPE